MGTLIVFLFAFSAFCGCAPLIGMNWDRIAVFVLRAINAPVFEEARLVAGLIYQRPGEWKADDYALEHPKVGRVRTAGNAFGIHVSGPFGDWRPSMIERRIIWNAVHWHQHGYIKSLLRKEIVA